MDSWEFVTRCALIASSGIACALCINGFVSKVLEKEIDRVARFAVGFFMIISGMLLSNSNFFAMSFGDSGDMRSFIRLFIVAGVLLTVQAMLSRAKKRYWWGALIFTGFSGLVAFLAYPYL